MLLLAYVSPFVSACQLTANSRRGGWLGHHTVLVLADPFPNDPIGRLQAVLNALDDLDAAIARLPEDLRPVTRAAMNGTLAARDVDADTARWLDRATAILARHMAGPPDGDLG